MTKPISILICLLLCAGAGYAADVYVGTAADLTNAVANAVSNDTVFVSNGTYQVNMTVGAGVTVKSISGLPTDVILDGNDAGRVVAMDASSWLVGCTVTKGKLPYDNGAGVSGGSCSNCIIKNSSAGNGNGGGAADCTLYNCLLPGNEGAAGGNVFRCVLYNCTLTGGNAAGGGGAASSTLVNCITWGNSPDDYFFDVTDSYSCSSGSSGSIGPGSISSDPLFVGGGDYRLQTNSPCKDTGNNSAWAGLSGSLDLDGSNRIVHAVVDMGAYENQYVPTFVVIVLNGSSLLSVEGLNIGSISGRNE